MKYQDIYNVIHHAHDYSLDVNYLLEYKKEASTLLEIGCGTGKHTALLQDHFDHIYAVDNDPEMIYQMKKNLFASHISCYQHDATQLDLLDIPPSAMGCAYFNVINYLHSSDALDSFFKQLEQKLLPKAFFIFDCLDDTLRYEPFSRSEFYYPYGDGKLHRVVESTYHKDLHSLRVHESYLAPNQEKGEWKALYKLWSNQELIKSIHSHGFEVVVCAKKSTLNPQYQKKNQVLYLLQKG